MSNFKNKENNIDEILSALDQFEQTLEVMGSMVNTVKDSMLSEFNIENHIDDIAQFNLENSLSPLDIIH